MQRTTIVALAPGIVLIALVAFAAPGPVRSTPPAGHEAMSEATAEMTPTGSRDVPMAVPLPTGRRRPTWTESLSSWPPASGVQGALGRRRSLVP